MASLLDPAGGRVRAGPGDRTGLRSSVRWANVFPGWGCCTARPLCSSLLALSLNRLSGTRTRVFQPELRRARPRTTAAGSPLPWDRPQLLPSPAGGGAGAAPGEGAAGAAGVPGPEPELRGRRPSPPPWGWPAPPGGRWPHSPAGAEVPGRRHRGGPDLLAVDLSSVHVPHRRLSLVWSLELHASIRQTGVRPLRRRVNHADFPEGGECLPDVVLGHAPGEPCDVHLGGFRGKPVPSPFLPVSLGLFGVRRCLLPLLCGEGLREPGQLLQLELERPERLDAEGELGLRLDRGLELLHFGVPAPLHFGIPALPRHFSRGSLGPALSLEPSLDSSSELSLRLLGEGAIFSQYLERKSWWSQKCLLVFGTIKRYNNQQGHPRDRREKEGDMKEEKWGERKTLITTDEDTGEGQTDDIWSRELNF